MVKKSYFNPKKIYKAVICIALALFGAVIALNPQRYTAVCLEGICLWAECVLPSLFPFMVVSLLLCGSGAINAASAPFEKVCKKLNLSPAALPLFLLSAVSGYPAGSRLLSEYYSSGKISDSQAKILAPLCSICSPAFALGTVGFKAFGGGYCGVKLILAAYISVIATTLIYALLPAKKQRGECLAPKKIKGGDLLYDSFYGAVNAVLCAGGFICFFYTLSKAVQDYNLLLPLTALLRPLIGDCADGLCLGLIEATGGIFAAARTGGYFAVPTAGFLLVFGGGSILFQQLCYLTKCKIKPSSFIFIKFIQGVAAFFILCLFGLFW
ncbi:MAG: hypothetical protein ACI4MB_02775 [Candidatus Coproplasma sp.]